MSAVIRIKRHIDEEPLSAFLLNCKKRKTDDRQELEEAAGGSTSKENDEDSRTTQILKFSGTLTKAEDLPNHILKITKDEAKELVSKTARNPCITDKNRSDHKNQSQNSRFKIVNCTRGIDSVTDEAAKSLTILDVEKEEKTSAISKPTSTQDAEEDKFVYDVYVPENPHHTNNDRIASDNLLNLDDISVVEYVDDFYSFYRDENRKSDSENNDSEDSNDENYWRNDYPDEDEFADDSSTGVAAMRRAVEDFEIDDDERELSSEDDYDKADGFVYSIDSEAIGFEDDLDYCDVNRYGEAYARYKKRILKNSDNNYLPKNYDNDDLSDYSD